MVTIALVMRDELPDQVPEMTFAEDAEVIRTLVPDGQNEAIRRTRSSIERCQPMLASSSASWAQWQIRSKCW